MSHIPTFEREPYRTTIDARVVTRGAEGGRPFVALSDTVLYPEGGGQPADRGTVDGVPVLDVQRVDGGIRHFVDGPIARDEVTVELDWARRFDHMQQHTAQHLLTAIADTRFGWPTTAFHLGERVSDIEVATPAIPPGELTELEEAVAAEIRAARPVSARRVSPAEYARTPVRSRGLPAGHTGSVRLVEIEGLDLNTCGGTHCASTAELEGLKLLGTESLRGGTRLFYVAGGRLRRSLGAHHARAAELRALFGVADDELVPAARSKLDQLKEAHRALRDLEDDLASAWAEGLASRPDRILVGHWADRDLPFLQRVGRELERLAPGRVAFLTCGEGESGAFVIAAGPSTSVDVSSTGARVAEILGGRGGGSGRLFQGRATALSRREEAIAFLVAEA